MTDDYVDDDPEYETEEDDDAVIAGLTAADPRSVPPDQGDAGKESNYCRRFRDWTVTSGPRPAGPAWRRRCWA